MRKNQITIKLERFGDQVPRDYPSTHQIISVYADSNEFSEALMTAMRMMMDKANRNLYERYPSFSSASSITSPDDLSYIEKSHQHAALKGKIRAAEDAILSKKKKLAKEQLFLLASDNIVRIAEIAANSQNRPEALSRIRAEFGLERKPQDAETLLDSCMFIALDENRKSINGDIARLSAELDDLRAYLHGLEMQEAGQLATDDE